MSSSAITLAFSPCPNDTFIFDAMVHHKIDTEGIEFDFRMTDVEELNHAALRNETDVTKVSFHAWLYLKSHYHLLDSGSALGRGNGPLVIARTPCSLEEIRDMNIAIPGEYTTAHLLLKIAAPAPKNKTILVFHRIEDAILNGEVDAGVIIHENRFTYEKKGLVRICDLGEYWENLTGSPIPLGGIVVKKSLGDEMIAKLNRIMRRSVEYAFNHPESVMDFVRANAQEMDEEVIKKHIGLYVNEFTVDLGIDGRNAISKLEEVTKDIFEHG
jgi:1,4-dihydroxy-6-naphthoate synthase